VQQAYDAAAALGRLVIAPALTSDSN